MKMNERQRHREVLAINRAIASAEERDEVLRQVVERTCAFAEATACLLLLKGEDGLARVVRSVGVDPARAARLALPLTERLGAELCDLLGFDKSDAFVGLPVIGKEGLMGVLAVYRRRAGGPEEPLDLELISAFADQAAIALDNARRIEELRVSEAKLAGIISLAADAIVSIDDSHRIVMFNEGAETIFGWPRDEILGRPLEVLMPERFRRGHAAHVRDFDMAPANARKIGERVSRIIHGLRKNGEEFPAEICISKLRMGGQTLFTAILRDITEQERAVHAQQFLAEVGGVLATTLDPQRTLTHIAQLAIREFGDLCVIEFADDQGEIQRLEVVTSDPSKSDIAAALKQIPLDRSRPHLTSAILRTRKPVLEESVSPENLRAAAQSDLHARLLEALAPRSMMGVPLIVREQLVGALVVVSCRAERRFGKADLALLVEVGHRAALALENARLHRASERAVQARDDVLGIVAHDLRNPLNAIHLQAGLLVRRGDGERRSTRSPAESIYQAATRMNRLIQDLLDVARIEAGHLAVERGVVPAAQLLSDLADAQRPLAAQNALELRLDLPADLPDVWGDRDRLFQVLENLVGNAVKFSSPGKAITVAARPGANEVIFSVADGGVGIAPDELPHVFRRFWQARRSGRRGAGLGLSIVKVIVEAHRGRVWVESALGQGSTFYFTVPVAAGHQDTPLPGSVRRMAD